MRQITITVFACIAAVIAGMQGIVPAEAACKGAHLTPKEHGPDHRCCPGRQKKPALAQPASIPCAHCIDRSAASTPAEAVKTTTLRSAPAGMPIRLAVWHADNLYLPLNIHSTTAWRPADPQITIHLHRILI